MISTLATINDSAAMSSNGPTEPELAITMAPSTETTDSAISARR